jgi:hypothetical protein
MEMIKVIDNALSGVTFGDLETGATFKYKNDYYMKTSWVIDQMDSYNAVDLSNGELCSMDCDDVVLPFNCELIVL